MRLLGLLCSYAGFDFVSCLVCVVGLVCFVFVFVVCLVNCLCLGL